MRSGFKIAAKKIFAIYTHLSNAFTLESDIALGVNIGSWHFCYHVLHWCAIPNRVSCGIKFYRILFNFNRQHITYSYPTQHNSGWLQDDRPQEYRVISIIKWYNLFCRVIPDRLYKQGDFGSLNAREHKRSFNVGYRFQAVGPKIERDCRARQRLFGGVDNRTMHIPPGLCVSVYTD